MGKLTKIFDRFFPPSTEPDFEPFSESTEKVFSNSWFLLSFSIFFIIPFSQSETNAGILLYILGFVFIFNGLLAGLISTYPNSILAWLLYPLIISMKIVHAFKTLLFQFLRNGRLLKFFGFVGLVWGFVFLMVKGLDLAKLQNYSFTNIYSSYGLVLATSIMFSLLIGILVVILFAVGFLRLIWGTILFFSWILIDQSKLINFSIISENRPKTSTEAIRILHSFKSNVGKAQFISGLFKWLPVGADPQVFIKEADKHHGVARDRLYQLAEVWEDSVRRKK